MEKEKLSWTDFLKYFIEEEKFRQNPLLKTDEFIKFCGKRGIRTNMGELEFFEKEGLLYPVARLNVPVEENERIRFRKDGKEFWRPAGFGLQAGETEIERYKVKLYAYQDFREGYKENLLVLLGRGDLFHPSARPFQEWKSFKGERLENGSERVVSFYSSFQIYALEKIKANSYVRFSFPFAKLSLDKAEVKKKGASGNNFVSFKIGVDYKVDNKEKLSLDGEQYDKHLQFRMDTLTRTSRNQKLLLFVRFLPFRF